MLFRSLIVRRLRSNKNLEVVLHDLKAQEQIEALKSGRIDIGFGRIEIEDPDVAQEILFLEPLIVALPSGHPLSHQQPTLQQLSELPLVIYPASGGPNFADMIMTIFYRQGLKVQVIQQVHDLQTALSLVASDMGFSLVPGQVKSLRREAVEFVRSEERRVGKE